MSLCLPACVCVWDDSAKEKEMRAGLLHLNTSEGLLFQKEKECQRSNISILHLSAITSSVINQVEHESLAHQELLVRLKLNRNEHLLIILND